MRQNNGLYVSCPACGDEESEAHGRLALLRTLCISVLFTMPLMWSLRPLIQFLLATVVQFWPGMYFYKGAYRALRQKILGMDFLVALSTTIIYAYSAYITFTVYHNTKLYFLSECVLLSLILFGKYMETTSRYEASAAIRRLINLQPETAHILRGGAEIEVGLNDILPSDSIVIRSGDHIPIDGVISNGECLADESMLTGESEPIRKQPGDTLYCGTLCRDGQVLLSCGSIGKTTMLQQIIDIVSNAQSEKAPIARLADKIATVFVPVVVLIAAAVFCVGAIVMLLRYGKERGAAAAALERQTALLRKYQARSTGEIKAALEDYEQLWESAKKAEQQELHTRRAYESARSMQSRLEESALGELDFASGDSETARLGRELTAARGEAERLSQQIAGINGRLAAMGDPLVLSSSLSCMKEEYELICDEYDAINLAIDTLREADTEIQSRFSPELGRVAAGYMSAVTGGRYSDVLINRDFTAKARTKDDVVARDAEYLSAGTLDIMYLAVRLAVCELALPEGETCPLIIDDALVNLDETRLEQAMALLREIAKERQIILFSCRKTDGR